MGKLKLVRVHRAAKNYLGVYMSICTISMILFLSSNSLQSQCTSLPGTIEGVIHLEENFNGIKDGSENGLQNVMVKAYNDLGVVVAQSATDINGQYLLSGLVDAQNYRIEFDYPDDLYTSKLTTGNQSNIQFISVPACDAHLALQKPDEYCSNDPQLALTCFVRGGESENGNVETLVTVEHDFNPNSDVSKLSMKSETGSVWGITQKKSTNQLFTSAFVKQYASLSPYGIGAIFKTDLSANFNATSLYIDLVTLGFDLGSTNGSDVYDCVYGEKVGKAGLGNLVISTDEAYLYVTNLHNNSIIKIPTENASASNIEEFEVPNPECSNGEYRVFALKYHNDKVYVGVTCTAETSKLESDSKANVYEFDPQNESFELIFSSNYIKGHWFDYPSNTIQTSHWLTDIEFTDEGHMILSLSDRIGHRFCNQTTGRLDIQNPDILMVWNNAGNWTLESNGTAGSFVGTGQNNGQGPDGGEFFAYEHWPANPDYHSETALGSVFAIPGTGEIIVSVYDPLENSYSGGLHRYLTGNGSQVGAIELYSHIVNPLFGKASGFGDIISLCEPIELEIGNYVWIDSDNDGIQDPGESPLANLEISLYDDACNKVATTITDSNGNYSFNKSNVDLNDDGIFDALKYGTTYYVAITDESFDPSIGALTINDENYLLSFANIGANTYPDLTDNDAELAIGICETLENRAVVTVHTNGSGQNDHSFDIGFFRPNEFDLALRKVLTDPAPVKYGELIDFTITVFNQGNIAAENIKVCDYLPSGLSFDEDLNPGWKEKDGKACRTITSRLRPGQSTDIHIKLLVNDGARPNELVNYAEIAQVTDQFGNIPTDVDSTPDEIDSNDNGGDPYGPTDNEIGESAEVDEDDHDPAMVQVFDLALKKVLENPDVRYMPGDEVIFQIMVYNQGNLKARNIEIKDTRPEGLSFSDNPINDAWQITDNEANYMLTDILAPGSSDTISIAFIINEGSNPDNLINIAEISNANDAAGNIPVDIDSDPNGNPGDDIGGNVYDSTNDEIFDNGLIDEDDHDPEMVLVEFFDLALKKTTDAERVKPGDDVIFDIYVINQGSIPADKITIVDYIPAEFELNDPNWTLDPSDPSNKTATYLISADNGDISSTGLLEGDEVIIPITLRLRDEVETGRIVNYAEIVSAFDNEGHEMTGDDIDSSPDMTNGNDMGGEPQGNTDNEINDNGQFDEDDHDPATIFVGDVSADPCVCLDNATEDGNGQFSDLITVSGASGETWYIESVDGLYRIDSDAPPASPISFETGLNGFILTENDNMDGTSTYTLEGIHIDGLGYTISFRNTNDETASVIADGCTYERSIINGANGACTGSMQEYSVENPSDDNDYLWEVSSGGTIIGANDESTVSILWGSDAGGNEIIMTESGSDNCYSPVSFAVQTGEGGGALSCVNNLNSSLDENCELRVIPEMVLTSEMEEGVVYQVMLMDESGALLPSNVLNESHVGYEFTVKIIDPCSGSSCWSTITVEDKLAPQLICSDTIVNCYLMPEYSGPVAIDNCDNNPTVTLLNEVVNDLPCHDLYVKEIIRTYIAEDASGNVSSECEQRISVSRINFDLIEIPDSLTVARGTALACDVAMPDMVPPFEFTGVPSIEGVDLYPNLDLWCNLGVDYNDIVLPQNGCVTKIMRVWRIYEAWCSDGDLLTYPQLIELVDDQAPIFDCPEDITLTTGSHNCEALVNLPSIQVSDNCSDEIEVDIQYPGGFLDDSNGGSVVLPAGIHDITYRVYDGCGNSDECTMQVTIEDNTAPVVVCDQHTVVGLRSDGLAEIYAATFDDGSYDECGIDRMEVMRMDAGNPCGIFAGFNEYVTFCCEDVNTTVVVRLRVYDEAGNSNECMVNVLVQDKFEPVVSCPDDVEVACGTYIDLDDLSEYGEFSAFDACGMTFDTVIVDNRNQCGVGTITRTFTAMDGNGSNSCTQTISVINYEPFEESDITWPLDFDTNEGCNAGDLLPENLPAPFNEPIVDEDFCDMVGVTYEDIVFPIEDENNSCLKIIRKWKVLDWCQETNGQTYTAFVYDQIIKVSNTVAPEITSSCEPLSTCTFDDNCEDGFISLIATATDDCTPDNQLMTSYSIDLNNDGSFEETMNGFGSEIDASGEYPIGDHRIVYEFEDRCGNLIACEQLFSIVNCKAPTAVCIEGLSVALIPWDTDGDGEPDVEKVCIYPEMFDASSFHPCYDELIFSFSSDINDVERCYDCGDIGVQTIELWVTDPNGLQDFCVTTVEVQDNNDTDICSDPKDCIMWPDSTVTITDCVESLDPDVIGFVPTVEEDCQCDQFNISYVDTDISDDANSCVVISRIWTVTFTCSADNACDFEQIITQLNAEAPELVCAEGPIIGSSTEGNCEAFVEIPNPDFDSSCNTELVITNDSPFANNESDASGIYPVGVTIVTFTATDACDNTSTCQLTVEVEDDSAPICSAQDVTVTLDENGEITINGDLVNDGSSDDCTDDLNLILEVNPSEFTCEELGVNQVILTVTDEAGNSSMCPANVTVVDTIAPICSAMDITITLDGNGVASIEASDIDDGSNDPCGEIVDLSVNPSDFTCDMLGDNTVTLTVTDNNGNSSQCEAIVTVVDTIAPICSAMDITVVLDSMGMIMIEGADVDNGSNDPCGMIVSLDVDPSEFTCDDLGENTVTLTVTDDSGNSSQCMATVTVMDTLAPICLTQDITVSLDENGEVSIEPSDVDNGSSDPCGSIDSLSVFPDMFFCNDIGVNEVTLTIVDNEGNMSSCTAMVTVTDTLPPMLTCPQDTMLACTADISDLSIYGIATATDNCDPTVDIEEIVLEDINACNVGVIVRTFIATDNNDNSSQCVQIITIGSPDSVIMESDITWPMDTVILEECIPLDPENPDIGMPMVDTSGAECFLLSIDYNDVNIQPGSACEVERTWTVIDSCQLNSDNNDGIFTFVQVLIINDTLPPVIEAIGDTILYVDSTCVANAVLPGMVSDCTDEITVSNDSPFANDPNSADLSGEYQLGEYTVIITAEDVCGNVSMDTIQITVLDTIRPDFKCFKPILEMPESGEIVRTISQHLLAPVDNCTDSIDFVCYWLDEMGNGMPGDTTFLLDCDNVGDTPFIIVCMDEAGNTDSCEGIITIVDPDGICDDNFTEGSVTGFILDENGDLVLNAEVSLEQSNMPSEMTNDDGEYAFPPMPAGNVYDVIPYRNDDPLNGVSTMDLIMIQRHLLGIESLDSPYKLIAADVNDSESITIKDVLDLRKLLLGMIEEFPNNTSWEMIDAEYQFEDPTDPFEEVAPEFKSVEITNSINRADFIAVKIGDVNNTAIGDGLLGSVVRDGRAIGMDVSIRNTGQDRILEFYANEALELDGFQFTLDLGLYDVEFIEVLAKAIDISVEHIGLAYLSEGLITFSWNDIEATKVLSGELLFSISLEIPENFNLRDVELNSKLILKEAYIDHEIYDITLNQRTIIGQGLTVFQNQPNPWSDQTTIRFSLSDYSNIELRVYDINGKLILRKNQNFEAGQQQIMLDAEEFGSGGVYYYELSDGVDISKNKMILID